jgi:hypothetical protein
MINNDGLHFETFNFEYHVNGHNYTYTIIENEGHFGIEYENKLIAEVQNNEHWEQTSGIPLTEDFLQALYDRIEDHYE